MPTEPFVPLTAAPPASARSDFRVLIAERPEQAQPLYAPRSGSPSPAAKTACEPRVSLQCEGDRVAVIHIQCSCGQVIDLACVYETAD